MRYTDSYSDSVPWVMNVVYYFDKETSCCPVKEYLMNFVNQQQDTPTVREWKERMLVGIDDRIQKIREANGRPIAPIAVPVHGYSFFEIKKGKDANTLIRITYFCHDRHMVLLHAFEKPRRYDDKKTRRSVMKEFSKTEQFRQSFLENPTCFQPYDE